LNAKLRCFPGVDFTGGYFQQGAARGMTVLPDEEKIPLRIPGNDGNAGVVVDPAQSGPAAVGQRNLLFPDLEDGAFIDYGH